MTYFTDYAVRPETLNWDGKTTARVMFFLGLGRLVYFLTGRFYKNSFFKSSFDKINYSFLMIMASLLLITVIDNPIVMGFDLFTFGFFAGLIYLSALDLLIIQKQKGKSTIAGLFESTIGIGAALTPIIAGILAETNVRIPFYFFAMLSLAIFILNKFVFMKKKD
jgi:fucose permease